MRTASILAAPARTRTLAGGARRKPAAFRGLGPLLSSGFGRRPMPAESRAAVGLAHFVNFSTTMFDLNKAKVTRYEELTDPKWVKTNLIHYVDPTGQERNWECCSRRTRVEGADCDGVGVIAILHKPEGPELLLQRQFRPPVEGICIEVPAGLLDPNETIETCAERELHEETGYIGKATKTSQIMFNDPGFCNTNMKMVHVDVDLSDKRNQDPQPQLEDSEFIETFSVPLKTLPEEIEALAKKGFKIDARVANLADGIELARALKL